ncbi:rhodanese-like domain-containing protein [Undibacterium sp. TJN19]|uniref:rhodanese-like domain-containing protein n=1 Tax=Undibacterium sp. TJN19 TaxID=3413055 RepID=UPI003BF124FC
MSTENIFQLARQRAQEQGLDYAGAVTPAEAYELLQHTGTTLLIDVRTNAERDWVGRVNIDSAQHQAVQWSLYPGGAPNPNFMQELQACVPDRQTVLLFLCRSGVRSRHAAKLATENAYENCFDILQGFEGDKDNDGHRKTVGGWCKSGLPWAGA